MAQIYEPKSKTWDDLRGRWVTFHTGNQYLLPIVSRSTKYVPVFEEDGSVTMERHFTDPSLGDLVDKFFATVSSVNQGKIFLSIEGYSDFIKMVVAMLKKNYDFSQEQLGNLLTMTADQLNHLVSVMVQHVRTI